MVTGKTKNQTQRSFVPERSLEGRCRNELKSLLTCYPIRSIILFFVCKLFQSTRGQHHKDHGISKFGILSLIFTTNQTCASSRFIVSSAGTKLLCARSLEGIPSLRQSAQRGRAGTAACGPDAAYTCPSLVRNVEVLKTYDLDHLN